MDVPFAKTLQTILKEQKM